MAKLRVKIGVIGHLPQDFSVPDLLRHASHAFEFVQDVDTFHLNQDAQGVDWQYTDKQLSRYNPDGEHASFTLLLLTVKLEENWYVRRLSENRVLLTFFEVDHVLRLHDIPLQNLVLRVVYAACLIYRRFGNRIPPTIEKTDYAHDETRGCLFDMNPWKMEVARSCDGPRLCAACVSSLATAGVSNELVADVQREINSIRKPLYYRIAAFVRAHPLWSITLSMLSAIILGITTSLIAEFLHDLIWRSV